MSGSDAADAAPVWTVVVPTYDRPDQLRRTLKALQDVRPPSGCTIEVVVVDDGGRRPAAAVVTAVPGPHPVRVHRQPNAGPAAARNAGAQAATGARLAFTDDDCRPRPEWLVALDAALNRFPGALVGGSTLNALRGNRWAEASQLVVDHVIETSRGGFLPSCNLAVERTAFLASGGFDAAYPRAAGEDRAFCDQWRRGGGSIVWVAGAEVDHEHDLGPGSFWRQHRAYGQAARQVHATVGGSQPGSIGDYLALIGRPLKCRSVQDAALLTPLTALSQAATAWGWWTARPRSGRPRA